MKFKGSFAAALAVTLSACASTQTVSQTTHLNGSRRIASTGAPKTLQVQVTTTKDIREVPLAGATVEVKKYVFDPKAREVSVGTATTDAKGFVEFNNIDTYYVNVYTKASGYVDQKSYNVVTADAKNTAYANMVAVGSPDSGSYHFIYGVSPASLKFHPTPQDVEDLIAKGKIVLPSDSPEIGRLCAHQIFWQGENSANIDFGTVVLSLSDLWGFGVHCYVSPTKNATYDNLSFEIDFEPRVQHYITEGRHQWTDEQRVLGFHLEPGSIHGNYIESVASGSDTMVIKGDVVDPHARPLQLRRSFQEYYLTVDLEGGSTIVERMILALDGKGRPIVHKNHFSATAPAISVARALNPDLAGKDDWDSTVQSKAQQYLSGIYVHLNAQDTYRSCMTQAHDSTEMDDCTKNATNEMKVAVPVGDRFMGGFGLSLGWYRSPTNRPASWHSFRSNFQQVLKEVMSGPLGNQSVTGLSNLESEAQKAISQEEGSVTD